MLFLLSKYMFHLWNVGRKKVNCRLKVNFRNYSIELLSRLYFKSDSANLGKSVLLVTARLKFDGETSVFSQF